MSSHLSRAPSVRRACAVAVVFAFALIGCQRDAPPAEAPPAATTATAPIVADPADWCAGHAIPESMCTKCNPELTAAFKAKGDWCAEHGYPESACPQCNPVTPPGAPARVGDPADWCGGHAIPESMCTKCNPELVAKFKAEGDWCAAHGYPESACPQCNPMQPPGEGAAADWCAGHGLPESKCTKCNPELVAGFKAAGDWCAEHGYPESACPQCNPVAPPGGAKGPIAAGTVIRLRDPSVEGSAGITTAPAREAAMGHGVEATARIDFDRNRVADVRAPVPGLVRTLHVDLGDRVGAGDPLFVLESARIGDLQARRGAARARVGAARANFERQKTLRKGEIASQRQLELARQELEGAEATLRSIDASLRLSGAAKRGGKGEFTITAPIAGEVVRRPAVRGTYARESDALALIADTATMWALVDVPAAEAGAVRVGQPVRVQVEGAEGGVEGMITWVAAEVDPKTRMVTARGELPNPDGRLRAGQFARATVELDGAKGAVTVPVEAVQRFEGASVVFVRTGAGVYEPRVVEPGRRDGERVQVGGGVKAGEAVVTTGAYLLRTELSRDSIGAGCCEVDAPGAK